MSALARGLASLSVLLDPLGGLIAMLPSLLIGLGPTHRWDTPRRRRRGVIFILGGIEGPSLYARAMAVGLLRSRCRGAVVVHRWNAGIPFIRSARNLMSRAHHERCAAELAARIEAHRRDFPHTPVSLLGQSGGCWVIVRTLETLGPHRAVDRAVLLCPAISPGYDPSRAAAACRDGLVSIRGPGDLFMLGLGTSLFGTSDRRHTPAAGLVGWRRSARGFHDVTWRPSWLRTGYLGNHITSASPAFIRDIVGPWLATGAWNG